MTPQTTCYRALACLLLATLLPALATSAPRTPGGRDAVVVIADPADLWEFTDPALQAGLEAVLDDLGLKQAARDGRLAVTVADITSLGTPRVASVNGDAMMYAASLPKIAILLGAYHKAQSLGTAIPEDLREDVVQMIRYSSNTSATRVLEWVGREDLLALLQSPGLRLYDPEHNGGLWVGKDYASSNAFHRDPLHNLSHGATTLQVARLFYLLEAGELLNPAHTREMKAALGDPGIDHKFVKGLAGHPEARIYRKSGTWKSFHADGALVESGGRRMVLVALAEDPRGGQWLADLAAPLHDLVLATAPGRAGDGKTPRSGR
jgi:beta-lactamase class A